MNDGLDKIHSINRELLREEDYLQSLLEQARDKGLIDENDIERLQYECLALLAYKTERFNAGDSSSIRVEKAQSLMASIFFTIGLRLKVYPNPDDAVAVLRNNPIAEIYQKGRNRINTLVRATQALHTKLISELVDTPNVFYSATLRDAILGFFKLYDPDYAAQEIHITADYPLCNHIPRLAGIEFIKAYVTAAYYENQFCARFPAEYIHRLLCERERGYNGMGYEELLINIYGHVLTAALNGVIVKTGMPVRPAVEELAMRLKCSDGLAEYMQRSIPFIHLL